MIKQVTDQLNKLDNTRYWKRWIGSMTAGGTLILIFLQISQHIDVLKPIIPASVAALEAHESEDWHARTGQIIMVQSTQLEELTELVLDDQVRDLERDASNNTQKVFELERQLAAEDDPDTREVYEDRIRELRVEGQVIDRSLHSARCKFARETGAFEAGCN